MQALRNRINAFWFKGLLSNQERLCLSSFVQNGYEVDLYSYAELSLLPGINLCHASDIIPERDVFFYESDVVVGKISAFSNYFRYAVLAARGGWWVDTDVICLGRLPEPNEFVAGFEEDGVVNSAVMFSLAGSPLMADAAEECRSIGKRAKWGEGGPHLITRLVKRHGLSGAIVPVHEFYPINWRQAIEMLLLPENADRARDCCSYSSTLHLWAERFRRAGIPAGPFPPAGSFLFELFQQFGFDTLDRILLDAEFVRNRLTR